MKSVELLKLLEEQIRRYGDLPVAAEHFSLGEAKNVASDVRQVVVEEGKLILVTEDVV